MALLVKDSVELREFIDAPVAEDFAAIQEE
jgi:hypothetical protein